MHNIFKTLEEKRGKFGPNGELPPTTVMQKIRTLAGNAIVICRPLPIPPNKLDEFWASVFQKSEAPSVIAEQVTGWRLGISPRTVREAPSDIKTLRREKKRNVAIDPRHQTNVSASSVRYFSITARVQSGSRTGRLLPESYTFSRSQGWILL